MTNRVTTREVVRRVLPLLERVSPRTLDKARLLQYLSARAAEDWGMLECVGEAEQEGQRVLLFLDRPSQEVRHIVYPACLPVDLHDDMVAEYKRLALKKPLTSMAPRLFDHFYRSDHCAVCRYDAARARQVCAECHYIGRPVNFEPRLA